MLFKSEFSVPDETQEFVVFFKRYWDFMRIAIVEGEVRVVTTPLVAEMHTDSLVLSISNGEAIFEGPGFDFLYASLHFPLNGAHGFRSKH